MRDLKIHADHYAAERRSAANFMDMPEPDLPVTADALKLYMEYGETCQCNVCTHCRLMMSMLERAEKAEAELQSLRTSLLSTREEALKEAIRAMQTCDDPWQAHIAGNPIAAKLSNPSQNVRVALKLYEQAILALLAPEGK